MQTWFKIHLYLYKQKMNSNDCCNSVDAEQYKNMSLYEWTNLILKAGYTDSEELQQLVELRGRHIYSPALNQTPVSILHHPQETHQEVPTGVCWQGGYRFTLLERREDTYMLDDRVECDTR